MANANADRTSEPKRNGTEFLTSSLQFSNVVSSYKYRYIPPVQTNE